MLHDFLGEEAQIAATYFNLTEYGATCISPYPDEWHSLLLKQYKTCKAVRTKTVTDPLRLYMYMLKEYAKSQGITVDHTIKYDLMAKLKATGSEEFYLPEDQREKPKPKKVREWPKGRTAFKFSPENRVLDDIAEAIKLVGYLAAGINGDPVHGLPHLENFLGIAKDKIKENPGYVLDLVKIMDEVNKFIEYSIQKYYPAESVELAQKKAAATILSFIPTLIYS
jgi:hypothetical protein